ncbi:MAG: recombinase family protein [Actinomycetota bacterium]|nr:recombinase family protein [Actinomycetota bacterium]
MWRVAIYAREAPGRSGRALLDRQVGRLVAQAARQPGWHHVATYADQSSGGWWVRPGLSRLLVDAPVSFDVVVVEGYGHLSPNRRELSVILDHLRAAGVTTIVLRPTAGRRFARAVANFALADVLASALS